MNLWSQFKRFVKYTRPSVGPRRGVYWLTAWGFWAGLFIADALIPLQYKAIIDQMTNGQADGLVSSVLWQLLLVLTVLYIGYNLCFRISDLAQYKSLDPTVKDLNDRLFAKLTEHSYQFFSDNFAGALVAKARRLSRSFEVVFIEIIYSIIPAIIGVTVALVVFSWQNIWLGVFFFIWLVFYLTALSIVLIYKNKFDLKRSEADSTVTASLADVISNILTVKVFSARPQEAKIFSRVTGDELSARLKSERIWLWQMAVQSISFTLLELVGMYILVILWSKGLVTIGTFVLVQLFFASLFNRLWHLGRSINKFTESLADASEMIDILEKPIEVSDPLDPVASTISSGLIEFRNMGFAYHVQNPVFVNFDLLIPSGQKVGLVGPSGCGKSTLVKLLLRFIDVDSGEILIDRQNIKSVTQDDLRRAIAYVPQDPSLFHRTLLENIKYGKPEATMEEVIEAAKKAHAHEFISELPQGYDTLVGERGIKLSGGERQRVAIARAILKDAPIIVLDEATSSLDTESEKHIKEAFDELIEGRTTIVIAHRLSTIQKMDRIIVMDKGKIVEDGTHQELIQNEEIYHRFWQYQISE